MRLCDIVHETIYSSNEKPHSLFVKVPWSPTLLAAAACCCVVLKIESDGSSTPRFLERGNRMQLTYILDPRRIYTGCQICRKVALLLI